MFAIFAVFAPEATAEVCAAVCGTKNELLRAAWSTLGKAEVTAVLVICGVNLGIPKAGNVSPKDCMGPNCEKEGKKFADCTLPKPAALTPGTNLPP